MVAVTKEPNVSNDDIEYVTVRRDAFVSLYDFAGALANALDLIWFHSGLDNTDRSCELIRIAQAAGIGGLDTWCPPHQDEIAAAYEPLLRHARELAAAVRNEPTEPTKGTNR